MTNHWLPTLAAFVACGVLGLGAVSGQADDAGFRMQEIATDLGVGYAVRLLDLNEDGRQDIAVVDTDRVVWYENPTWQVHTLIEGQTKKDNVCFAPHDIDRDGHLDFALGADWRPFDTQTGGTIQWLSRNPSGSGNWVVRMIGEEPTVHRMRWIDIDGDGPKELVVVPLMGRNTTKPLFQESPVRVLAFRVPADPVKDRWPMEVLNEDLHVTHNFCPVDLNGDDRTDILITSFEGVSLLERGDDGRWGRTLIGAGNQQTSPNRGASEIKHGLLAGGKDYIATIEPWHGHQVVVYTRPDSPQELWTRHVLDEDLLWGHAVWCADVDGDPDQELIIGVRDDKHEQALCGVRIYDPLDATSGKWRRKLVDAGGVAVEDLAAGDLNGDGRIDLVAVGRKTQNVRIYWNEAKP